jgi:hypothetical protein
MCELHLESSSADEAVVEVEASFPVDGELFEVVQERQGLLDDVADPAQSLMFGALLGEVASRIRRLRSSRRLGLLASPLSPSRTSGRLRGLPRLPATGGMSSFQDRDTSSKEDSVSSAIDWHAPAYPVEFNAESASAPHSARLK